MSDLTVHAALSPRVAILSSPDVDRVIQTNNIPDLAALLRPFEASVSQLSVRTSQLENRLCQRFPLRFDPLRTFTAAAAPQQDDVLDSVSAHIGANAKHWLAEVDPDGSASPQPADLLQQASQRIESLTPWFIHFRDAILHRRSLSPHSTFDHPVALLLAVSSASPDPMNDFARLYETAAASSSSSGGPFAAHPFIDPNVLRYYLLLHDVHTSGPDLSQSLEVLDHVKRTYGLHCCLLTINSAEEHGSSRNAEDIEALWSDSRPPASPPSAPNSPTTSADVARLLDDEDIKRLKGFVRELTAQSIVPFMERCVQQWNEQLASSRKGLTGRLFGASRKFFGGSAAKVAASASSSLSNGAGYSVQHDFYPFASVEAQTRRLADFAFTIRDYKLAAAMYDLGRKDFAGDKAWRHSAVANEMFGLSHLMLMYTARTPPIDVDSYLSQACHEYALKPAAGGDLGPLRATLLYYEAYRALGYYRPAPVALQRMANASEEVFGALLLEQAAMADLRRQPKAAVRKCALHLVMAAHRYQSCGQKALSLRCYAQAAALYRHKAWTSVENHLERELGMQAYNGGDADAAVAHLSTLLRPGQCSAEEHEAWLKDLLTAYRYAGGSGGGGEGEGDGSTATGKPEVKLPQPLFNPKSARLRVAEDGIGAQGGQSRVPDSTWTALEGAFMAAGFSSSGSATRKRPATLSSSRDNRAAVDATFWLDVAVENPLNTAIEVKDIRPHLRPDDGPKAAPQSGDDAGPSSGATATESRFEAEPVDAVMLGPREVRWLSIPIRVREAGVHRVTHISSVIADELPITESLDKRGKRLGATREQRLTPTYAPDQMLRLTVHEAEPAITASLASPPSSMLLGEECRVELTLRNVSGEGLRDVRALCNQPDAAVFVVSEAATARAGSPKASTSFTMPNDLKHVAIQDLVGDDEILAAGQERTVPLLLKASRFGVVELAWLVVFGDSQGRFHTSRLSHRIEVEPSLEVSVQSRPVFDRAKCDYRLSVEVSNVSLDETVTVTGLSFVGPCWRCSVEDEPSSSPTSSLSAKVGTSLEPCQAVRLSAVLGRTDSRGDEDHSEAQAGGSMAYTLHRLQAMLQSREVDAKNAPRPVELLASGTGRLFEEEDEVQAYPPIAASSSSPPISTTLDSPHHQRLLRQARLRWRQWTLSQHFQALSEADRAAAFVLYEPNDVDVVVHWQQQQQPTRRGSSYVFGLSLGPSRNHLLSLFDDDGRSAIRSMYAQTVKERGLMLQNLLSSRLATDEAPLVVDLCPAEEGGSGDSHEAQQDRRTHDFAAKGPTRLGLSVWVRNFSDSLDVDFEVQLGRSEAPSATGAEDDTGEPEAEERGPGSAQWMGRRTLRGTLQPRSAVELAATVRIEGPGLVRPGRLTVQSRCYLAGRGGGEREGGAGPGAAAPCSQFTQHVDPALAVYFVQAA
ncbi:uncharacterized protein PFL1_01250 [Pseudozyma flocculosa PF-1]|uniref:ER-golgi trafficking TRAPP I complex 85 kDa subunit-domain-containing protein n=1 Tax=Pseudozyma flocculosa TaxID=84751 RepID=A0A5C3EVN0_9BASI|nr:uncharacterized protein PFL1_01250 [Pseudozyma flocculosa PF-1]EPQ31061.1 hypothetical protein PFL1_01250 [Pseudozyma flocculosa PF-1]SPO35910.1 uncharacterized protein PSFLO_01381 [Pseudozyma flocculosa]